MRIIQYNTVLLLAKQLEQKKESVDELRKKLEEQQRQLDQQQLLIEFLKDRLQQWTVAETESDQPSESNKADSDG